MSQKWNLQDIRPASSGKERVRRTSPIEPKQDIAKKRPPRMKPRHSDEDISSIDIIDGGSQKKKRIFISAFVAILILAAGFGMSILLTGADVTVYPKYKDTTVQASFTSHIEPQVGELGYELLTLEANGERQVSATGEEVVSERAIGTLLIYNAYSEKPQRLIKNTRFESPDGLIYRISESVEVPGSTTGDDESVVPGVVSAEVFADGTGEQYNIDPAKFTIPGLKGTDQYEKMYAESTVEFTGGFEGSKFMIEETELQTAQQSLHLELRDTLLARLKEETLAGFILYEDAITFAFDSLPATEYGDKLATIKERARLQVPIFKESQFAQYLAENTVPGYEGEPIYIDDPHSLTYSYTKATTSKSDIATLTTIDFNLTGDVRLIWSFDESVLQSDIVGLPKTALSNVLSGYPAIERAEAVVRPFWSQSFPNESSGINIITIIGESE